MKIGKITYLLDAFGNGRPAISITCTATAYRRADGSVYVNVAGKRRQLIPLATPAPTYAYALVTNNREFVV